MVVIAAVMIYPFYYMLDNAFRNPTQFDRQRGHSLSGWSQLFQNLPVLRELLNSTIVCAGAILIILVVSTTAGFAFAKLRYRGSGTVFLLVVAAIMDGMGYERTFLQIAIPLSLPAIATVTVLQFIQIWDDLLVGLLFLQNPSDRTITVGLAALSSGRTTSIPPLMAGSLISALPAIAVYLIFQRHLVKGLTLGMGK